MSKLQGKGFSNPDQRRSFPHGKIDVVQIGDVAVGRYLFEPGWRWSKDVAPIVGTRSCQHRHLGYTMSGCLHVVMDDGTELVIRPGEAYEIPPGHDAWVEGDEPFDSVEFSSARFFAMSPEDLNERELATILFSDIVDSTSMLERLGDRAWAAILEQHDVRTRQAIDRFRGRESATLGDGFLALFDGPARAVRAGAQLDEAMRELGVRVRVGIHTGEVELVGGQARGVAVHTAARVSSLAGAGEVLVSSVTRDLLDGSGLAFELHGEFALKGLEGKRTIYALRRQS
jgi:class 3 adenylate cyclase